MSAATIRVAFDDPDATQRYEVDVPATFDARAALEELVRHAYAVDDRLRARFPRSLPDDVLRDAVLAWGTIDGKAIL